MCRMWMNLKSIWETLSPVNLIKQSADSFTLRFLSRPSTHSSQVCIRYTLHRVYKYLVTWLIQKILHAYRDDLSWDQISKSNYQTTATFISDFNKRTHCYFYKEYINLFYIACSLNKIPRDFSYFESSYIKLHDKFIFLSSNTFTINLNHIRQFW